MILRKLSLVAVLMMVVFSFQSCNDNENAGNTARVQLKLIDAPGIYDQVNVQIIDVQYNNSEDEEGWVSFTPPETGYPSQIDLTELIAGNSLLLSDEIMEAGMLKQIRLILGENNTLVFEDEPTVQVPLNTPSALQSGLKLNLNEELIGGFSYTFVLDWDVQKSVVSAGNSGTYNLKPVIRVNAEVNSGSIKGNVVGKLTSDVNEVAIPFDNIVVLFFDANDLTTSVGSTFTDEFGDFSIQGLPEGFYVLKIEEYDIDSDEILDYQEYQSENIEVTVGMVNELNASIELLLVE